MVNKLRCIPAVRIPESSRYAMAAVLTGLGTASGIWIYKGLIRAFHRLAFSFVPTAGPGRWLICLPPVLGGALVGWLSQRFLGQESLHGVTGIIESVARRQGELAYRKTPVKALASAISIGSGASVGPEDPSVQVGANLASFLARLLALTGEQRRLLVTAGAAAGIAAAFNAPVASVFFAAEILLGEISTGSLGVVVLAAVSSAALTQAISGVQPAFLIPSYSFRSLAELPFYFSLGLLTGPVSAIYVRLLYLLRHRFAGLRIPLWLKTMLAGTIVGVSGIFLPQILGTGYDTIEDVLQGATLSLAFLLVLMLTKLVLTPLCLGGGFVGGMFAPALFIGTMLGAAYGQLIHLLFPGWSVSPPAFALVSMAAMLAGAIHAPMTAILLLFEMTRDYHIILPLMFAVVVSLFLSRRLERHSAYTLGLVQAGLRLDHIRLQRALLGGVELEGISVEAGAACAGKPVRALPWPRAALIVALRRERRTIIPRATTRIRPGDLLIFIAEAEAREQVYALCRQAGDSPPLNARHG